MRKNSAFCFLASFITIQLFFSMNTSYSTIISVDSHQEVKKYVKPTSILIYDIDETLTYREGIFFHPRAHRHKKRLKERIQSSSPVLYQNLISILHKNTPMLLMEEDIPALINNFMAQGTRVFACTKRYHGHYGVIDRFEEHTHNLLQKLGITFNFWNYSFFYQNPLNIALNPQECTSGRSCKALFFNNIYFTDDNQKGPALQALFTTLGYIPEHVVFVDDLYDNLVSVENTLTEWGIPVTCIHYTNPQPDISFSKKELVKVVKRTLKTAQAS